MDWIIIVLLVALCVILLTGFHGIEEEIRTAQVAHLRNKEEIIRALEGIHSKIVDIFSTPELRQQWREEAREQRKFDSMSAKDWDKYWADIQELDKEIEQEEIDQKSNE